MPQEKNNVHGKTSDVLKGEMDRESVEDHLNSDNAFSDKGLNNARLTREAMKKGNQ
ncbi:hypothetical protein [Bacillus thermotolerans]|uniref:Uncharacterized protein n=1 Tax=Bacillus thermotolerans TaxID=1221996 RepID=A0A0F5HJU9_BACTR|nr:hypothetical protein [Bacillus thermotolerans]KKB33576.1 hypothetical protein QY97_03196 [Bacillus thermotolerans]KKB35174.1 hypothetical protein QY95_03578 [Bacillus thermotolerans]KKB38154.1 hypothetical protein QY96_03116 [Bacillus thermotolerans]